MEASVKPYIRSDLHGFAGYTSARTGSPQGTVWLNANEAASSNPAAPAARRYPDPQPAELLTRLAAYYGVHDSQVLVGRGSDEGIDVLIRATCHARQDAIVVCPPTFGMYEVSATIHGAHTLRVPQIHDGTAWHIDWPGVERAALGSSVKLVFICHPGNPTGSPTDLAAVAGVASALAGRALVVVDEAYQEFSGQPSAISLLGEHENIVVLRTLSKAFGLAGLRVGSVIAAPPLIRALRACQAPYPLPEPVIRAAISALHQNAWPRVATTKAERERLTQRLRALSIVETVFMSEANFVLVRFTNPDAALTALAAAGIVVRDQRYHKVPGMHNALRITVGTPKENDQVIACLEAM